MKEITKEKILKTADCLFSTKGVRMVSIDDICKKLQISKKTFYQFYPHKEELVGEVMSYHLNTLRNKFFDMIEDKDPNVILRIVLSFIEDKREMLSRIKLLSESEKYYPTAYKNHTKERLKFANEFGKMFVTEGVERGVFRQNIDYDSLFCIFAFIHKGMTEYFSSENTYNLKKKSYKSLAEAYKEVIKRSILTDSAYVSFTKMQKDYASKHGKESSIVE